MRYVSPWNELAVDVEFAGPVRRRLRREAVDVLHTLLLVLELREVLPAAVLAFRERGGPGVLWGGERCPRLSRLLYLLPARTEVPSQHEGEKQNRDDAEQHDSAKQDRELPRRLPRLCVAPLPVHLRLSVLWHGVGFGAPPVTAAKSVLSFQARAKPACAYTVGVLAEQSARNEPTGG